VLCRAIAASAVIASVICAAALAQNAPPPAPAAPPPVPTTTLAPKPGLTPVPANAGWCLTGNAPKGLEARNRVAPGGCYTFRDGLTDAAFFPSQPGSWEKDYTAGWVPFDKGLLTNPKISGYLRWAHYWVGQNMIDIVIDLKKDYLIRRVELECYPGREYLGRVSLFLKSPGEPRYTMVMTSSDRYAPPGAPATDWPRAAYAFDGVNATSRWVRLVVGGTPSLDYKCVRIWGDTAPAKPAAKVALVQGKPVIADPKEIPFSLPDEMGAVFPIPQQIKLTGKDLVLTAATEIVFAPADSARSRTTAEVLRDEIKRETGLELKVAAVDKATPGVPAIRLNQKATAPELRPEGYQLLIAPSGAQITGIDGPGVFYGTQSLLQLLRRTPQGWTLRGCEITDWPVCAVRYVQGRRAVDENLIRGLARMKINYYHFSNISAAAATVPFTPIAEKYCVKLVMPAEPRFLLPAHPELAELNAGEDYAKMEKSRVNFCPSNPKLWELYFAEVDKWLDKLNGDYVSVSYDEMYQSGSGARYNVCPLCRARNLHSWEVLADSLNRMAGHFAKHGKKLFMLDTCFFGRTISNKEDTDSDWRKALDKIPKDTLIGVWHPKEVNKILGERGFPQLRWANSPYGKKKESFPQSTVDGVSYVGLCINMLDAPFSYTRLVGLAQVTWSPNRAYCDDEAGSLAMDHMMPSLRRVLDNARSPAAEASPDQFFAVDLTQAANNSFVDEAPCDGKGWADLGPNLDLRAIVPGERKFCGVPFTVIDEKRNDGRGFVMVQNWGYADRTLPNRAEFAVGRKAASMIFLHALQERPGQGYLRKNELAGYYIAVYEDGTYARMDIKYDINAEPWLSSTRDAEGNLPAATAIKRGSAAWRGETRSGNLALLYATEWINPRPTKTIEKIILLAAWKMSPMNPMLVAVTGVAPRGDELDEKGTWPPAVNLTPASPVGIPVDLLGGREETIKVKDADGKEKDEPWRRYVAPDGTVLEGSPIERVATGYHPGTHPTVASVANVLTPGNVYFDPKQGTKGELIFTFPSARRLTGVLLHGPVRSERKVDDFGPARPQAAVSISDDGVKWTTALKSTGYDEEQGPRFIPFPDKPVRKVRLEGNGFSLVQFYKPQMGDRP
jgi:hypothetical protein